MLYAVKPADPLTFAGVTTLLLAVALTATAVPAWRAARVDPSASLRDE
jgi:putative ABC transport system permease protein